MRVKSVVIKMYLITPYHLSKLEIVLKFCAAMLANMLLPSKIQEPRQIQISDNKKYFQYEYILPIFASYILNCRLLFIRNENLTEHCVFLFAKSGD